MDVDDPERACPACGAAVENSETVIFFGGEMYHLRCAPGATPGSSPEKRQPRY